MNTYSVILSTMHYELKLSLIIFGFFLIALEFFYSQALFSTHWCYFFLLDEFSIKLT